MTTTTRPGQPTATFLKAFTWALGALAGTRLTHTQYNIADTLADTDNPNTTADICSAYQRAHTISWQAEAGVKITPTWGARSPAPPMNRPRWVDHAYRRRRDGRTEYIAEPYHLDPDDIADLHRLGQDGWDVWITAQSARHYPARTLVVSLTRRPTNNNKET